MAIPKTLILFESDSMFVVIYSNIIQNEFIPHFIYTTNMSGTTQFHAFLKENKSNMADTVFYARYTTIHMRWECQRVV